MTKEYRQTTASNVDGEIVVEEHFHFSFTIEDLVGAEVRAQFRYGSQEGYLLKPGGKSLFYGIIPGNRAEYDEPDFIFCEADVEDIKIEKGVATIILK